MPIYEYDCRDCGRRSECFLRSAGEEPVCQWCGSRSLARLVSRFAFKSGSASAPEGRASAGCSGCPGGNCSTCGH
ncbi:MAG: zinc ribbon domain-containing protein [Elusimicrobia bacterium]|nr:zinc ribbon domain-containing protein [Elusimicrobiota bacterium]